MILANQESKMVHEIDMSGTNLYGANMTGANMRNANMRESNMAAANMTGAIMTGANMRNANMTAANMTAVNLFGANMTGANMHNVCMREVHVCGIPILAVLMLREDYTFFVCADGFIRAGCRTFTPAEYRLHVATYPEGDARRGPTLTMIAIAEAIYAQEGN